jgi:glycosyltransferase involved in cell wall biosynthesis
MCILVPGYNNNAKFRIEHNLNSIFMQNYTNYKAVIIDDASTDGSLEIYKKYFAFYKIDKKYYTLISNPKKATAMTNHYFGTIFHCRKDSIVLNLDGDDEFIGRNVLKLFNWGYQTKKSGVLYTNFYWYQQPTTLMYGFTSEYSEHEKKNNLYRTTGMKYSHLRSFRA